MAASDVSRVKEAVNIVEVIGEHVNLRRSGPNFVGLCPFHNEKTPSLVVSPVEQKFHCFGCGVGGDVFDFVSRVDNLDFRSVLELLANRAGVEVSEQTPKSRDLYDVLSMAQGYFIEELNRNPVARAYLERRSLTLADSEKFNLGYSRASWDGLTRHLRAQKVPDSLIVDSGLAVATDHGQLYDRFRGRLMFPIRDKVGRIVAFSGQIVDGEGAKYINSPETEIYSKRRNLYLLDKARTAIKDKGRCILVEGQMDAIRLHLNGYPEAVATLGTALSPEQAAAIKQLCPVCYTCFDSDTAGQAATLRNMYQFQNAGLEVYVISLPTGKDPDELLSANPECNANVTVTKRERNCYVTPALHVTSRTTLPVTSPVRTPYEPCTNTVRTPYATGSDLFAQALESALPLVLYHLHAIRNLLSNPQTRTDAVRSFYKGLSKLDNSAIAPYAVKIASALGLYPQTFWDDLNNYRHRNQILVTHCHTPAPQNIPNIPKVEAAMCALLWTCQNPHAHRDLLQYFTDPTTKQLALYIMTTPAHALKTTWESTGDSLPLEVIDYGQSLLNIIIAKFPRWDIWAYTTRRLAEIYRENIRQNIIKRIMNNTATIEDWNVLKSIA